jgi:hypothetical protein
MAKPILRTPELEGTDAERFVKLHSEPTLSKEDRAILKSCVETYKKNSK